MTQHYYVIYFDEETKEWFHDCDVESARFNTGTIWNESEDKWESGYLGDGIWNNKQEEVDLIMNDGLQFLNRISATRHLTEKK